MLSAGMLTDLASAMIVRSRGLVSGSPPPPRAATVNSLMRRVNILPRFASAAPFLCLIVCHLEWPDMVETPAESTRSDGNLITSSRRQLARQDDPNVRPLIPRAAPVIAKHGLDDESGALESSPHGPNRQRSEREVETMLYGGSAAS